jgi:hypothetical protein
MAAFSAIAAGVTAVVGIGGSIAKSKKAQASRHKTELARQRLRRLEMNRQPIINPYAGQRDLSGMAKDLSGMVSNPYAQLGVATQAAVIEIEEADIALANTLDTLRATGASAGGATALAQAALRSKKGVSASIEAQEAQNEQLKAKGKQQLEMLQMQEASRIQGIKFSEAQRMQQSDLQGKAFMWQQQEGREMQQLNRLSAQIEGYQRQRVAAQQASAGLLGASLGAIGQLGSVTGSGN